MKIYVEKQNTRNYMIAPVPTDLENYHEVDISGNYHIGIDKKYDPTTGDFVIDEEYLCNRARKNREKLLQEMDEVVSNPLRWEELSSSDKQSVKEYRGQLLNIPEQEGFPLNIDWPSTPEVLK